MEDTVSMRIGDVSVDYEDGQIVIRKWATWGDESGVDHTYADAIYCTPSEARDLKNILAIVIDGE